MLASTIAKQAAHLLAKFGIAPCFRSLPFQRCELLFHFDENVVHARKIDLRGFELRFREPPLRLVHRDARGLFDDGAAIHRLRIQDLADAALLDDRVTVRAQPHAHENFLDVAKAGDAPVDEIFALAGAIKPARNDDFARLQRDRRLFRASLFPRLRLRVGRCLRPLDCMSQPSPDDSLRRLQSAKPRRQERSRIRPCPLRPEVHPAPWPRRRRARDRRESASLPPVPSAGAWPCR